MFDLTSLGAVVENIVVASQRYGFESTVEWLFEASSPNKPVAKVQFHHADRASADDDLFESIYLRCTNRKQFSRLRIPDSIKAKLLSIDLTGDVAIDWIENRRDINRLATLIAQADQLRFASDAFHAEFFKLLRYTKSHVDETRDGLDVKTLELPIGGKLFLRCFENPLISKVLRSTLGSHLLAAPSAISVRNSGAIVVFSVRYAEHKSFFECGRAIQRAWLKATSEGLAIHPLGSLPIFLTHKTASGEFEPYADLLNHRLTTIVPSLSGRTAQLVFRVGICTRPALRSLRRPVKDVLDLNPKETNYEHTYSSCKF